MTECPPEIEADPIAPEMVRFADRSVVNNHTWITYRDSEARFLSPQAMISADQDRRGRTR